MRYKVHTNLCEKIVDYESGRLSDDDTVELFQTLIDNGMAWTLQGMYGRMAMRLIDAGLCTAAGG